MEQNSLIEYGFRRVIITITVILCSLLELIDTTIVNVATTQLMGSLGATLSEVSWVIAAYGIANIIVVPMSGWLSATLGRKNYYAGSVLLFTFASFLCGQSHSLWELVAFRFIQGIGGGALLATAQSILAEIYPPEKRGMSSAMFGMGVILGPTLGPMLGGYIIENFDWPVMFYVNIPIGIVACILAYTYIKDYPKNPAASKQRKPVDWLGIGLLIMGIGSLQLILEQGNEKEWFDSGFIITFTITAAVGIIGFIWRELSIDNPIVDLRVMKRGNVAIGALLSFILGFGLFASVFIYPVFVQRFLGFTALQTGISLFPGALVSGFMMPLVGTALQKGVPGKFLVPFGFLIFGIFCIWCKFTISPLAGADDFFWPLFIRGLGLGLLFVPLTTISLGGLKGLDIAQSAGISSMMRQLGGAFGVAIVSSFVTNTTQQHRADVLEHVSIYEPATVERLNVMTAGFTAKAGNPELAQKMAYASMDFAVNKQASVLSYQDVFWYLGIFFVICMPLVLFARVYKAKVDTSSAH